MRPLSVFTLAFLAGCAGNPTLPEVVKIAVPVPCLSESPKSPAFITDADLAKLEDYEFVISLAKDRQERKSYEAILEAALAGCL